MKLEANEILRALGNGRSIENVCIEAGLSPDQFQAWWSETCRASVPNTAAEHRLPIGGNARIDRDRWGIPHIHAADDPSLFFALGYAAAQDRLFQLEFLRRKATGRVAEILGPSGVTSDTHYRTIDLAGIASREWQALPDESRQLLQSYTDGINAFIDRCDLLPIEFALFDYAPERWRPEDSLAIVGEFRWYLTGRLPVIAVPELMKRTLGDGALYHAALAVEAGEEHILWPGDYMPAMDRRNRGPQGDGGAGDGGSNNWAISGQRTASGKPLIAGDPHLPFFASSIWYEARLHGGSFQVGGVMLSGMPAIMIGRNRDAAWTITNNICSLRDLYQERTSESHPNCFFYDGAWEPATNRTETIRVRGSEPVHHVVRGSRNGPIVDHLLPAAAREIGAVSLRWVGREPCGWLTALLQMNRARNVRELCEATRPWVCPTFNVVSADVHGNIALQTTGRIPIRTTWERGCRPGWDPQHQWRGLATFEEHPRVINPERGFLISANNRVSADDYPIQLNCTATSGHRARRVRQEIERVGKHSLETCRALQLDVVSLRARECVPALVAALQHSESAQLRQALQVLRSWNGEVEVDMPAPTIFNVFFANWLRAVAVERFAMPRCSPAEMDRAILVADRLGGLAVQLLSADVQGWFIHRDRLVCLEETFQSTLDWLSERFGPEISEWRWSRIHTLLQPHYLTDIGELGHLLDLSGMPVRGDTTTVCSSISNVSLAAYNGAGQRMLVDLADPKLGFWTMEAGSSSGHVGSPHYRDQLEPWSRGVYRYASLDPVEATREVVETTHLHPIDGDRS